MARMRWVVIGMGMTSEWLAVVGCQRFDIHQVLAHSAVHIFVISGWQRAALRLQCVWVRATGVRRAFAGCTSIRVRAIGAQARDLRALETSLLQYLPG